MVRDLHNGEFHNFGLWWEPTRLRFYYDGQLVREEKSEKAIPHVPQYLIISGGIFNDGWVDGSIHTANWTDQYMDVDSIRVWELTNPTPQPTTTTQATTTTTTAAVTSTTASTTEATKKETPPTTTRSTTTTKTTTTSTTTSNITTTTSTTTTTTAKKGNFPAESNFRF